MSRPIEAQTENGTTNSHQNDMTDIENRNKENSLSLKNQNIHHKRDSLQRDIRVVAEALKPKICSLFGVNDVNDVSFFRMNGWLLLTDSKGDMHDKCIQNIGLTESLGFIHSIGYQEIADEKTEPLITYRSGEGVSIFETPHTENPIRYAIIKIFTNQMDKDYITIVPSKDWHRLFEYWHEIATSRDIKEPILNDNKLQEILNNTFNILTTENAKRIEKLDESIKRGVIFAGPPGNGKTMTIRYIRQLCEKNNIVFNLITNSRLRNAYSNDSLENLFKDPGITVFDDVDISIFNRKSRETPGSFACAILSAMDGVNQSSNVIRIFCTNEKLSEMDDAFKRPGRIDKVFHFESPTKELRKRLIETWPEDIKKNIDIDEVADKTSNMSFAEINSIKTIMVTDYVIEGKEFNFDDSLEKMKNIKYEKEKENSKINGIGF